MTQFSILHTRNKWIDLLVISHYLSCTHQAFSPSLLNTLTYTLTLSHSHIHAHAHTYTNTDIFIPWITEIVAHIQIHTDNSVTRTLSLSLALTLSIFHTPTLSQIHLHPLSHILSFSHTHFLSLTLSRSLSSRTHTLSTYLFVNTSEPTVYHQ